MLLMVLEVKFPHIHKYSYNGYSIITINLGILTIKWFNKPCSALMKLVTLENIENIAKNDLIINNMQKDYDELMIKYKEESTRLMNCINDLQSSVHDLTVDKNKKSKKIK